MASEKGLIEDEKKDAGHFGSKPEQPAKKSDGNSSFLRAARAGNLDKVLEFLKGSIDINTSNANGLNALHLASKEGHVNVVTELLDRGANVDAATKKGNTALHIASLAGQEEIVKILVQRGAKVNSQATSGGFTPLYMAAQENHVEVVKYLLNNGASQTTTTDDGFTPLAVALQQGHDKVVAVLLENDTRGKVKLPALHIAAKKDDVKAATLLLQNEHSVDGQSKSGFTPLHIASHYGNITVGTLLIDKGANVNFKARNQITPLHVASKWGKTNMVTLLLDNKAQIDSSTRDGLTSLHCGARSGHDQVVDLLLEKGAPVDAKTKNKLTPLHMAAQGDHVDCARLLLIHKAPIDEVTVDYLTPLHVAAHCGNVKTAKLLLDRKCEVDSRALNGFTPLHIACKKNRIKVVELLLKYGASIEATTETGLTPLHVAAFMGHMNIVIYLIQHGANPDTPNMRGETALHHAARANQTDIMRILLRNGAHVDARAREQQTPLHIAARLGNVDNVLLLLQHGASPDATTKDLYTPLHIAAKEGHEEVVSVLLDHGASQTLSTKKGFTPLHIAAKYGNMQTTNLLLQKGADANMQGKNGLTPLHVATHYNHSNVALLLLENGASPHTAAKNGYTPLHIAAKKDEMDIATSLLEYGAKPNAESKNGFTPLHLATQEGHTDMVSLLCEHGADVGCKAKNGLTPMHLAAQEDKVPVAEVLVKYGAEIDTQTKAGYTSLHTACHFGQINMIRFLLEHNADVTKTTKLGYTPLHQAAQQGHVLVINLLLKYKASPNAVTNNGQTPLSIAQRLGYISVVEILKNITEVQATQQDDKKYEVQVPEGMQEAMMTDSEDEGEDTIIGPAGDTSFQYMTTDDMKHLHDDSISPMKDDRDFSYFERYSVATARDSMARESTLERDRGSSYAGQDNMGQYLDGPDNVFDRMEGIKEAPLQAAYVPGHLQAAPPSAGLDESRTSMYGSYSGVSYGSSFDPDNVAVDRHPVYSGFLVSFMVDARGGAMRGCRHSGVRIIIPPGKACMPTRVTCKLVKKEKLMFPPPLMEGEALASRILEMGPVGAKFLGPVIIEVPHFASLRGHEREIVILRSEDGEHWKEHPLDATEDAIQEALGGSFEDLESAEELYNKRITRILATEFPNYFAIVTRIRQESSNIGPEGGMISSTVVPQVQAVFPDGALTKKIKVGLQAQEVPPESVTKLLGNRVAVSPIVTVEPRRRKFHKPITLTIPVPKAAQKGMLNQYGGDSPTLRLLCSITGGTNAAQWEDVTGTSPLTFVNDCVSFTTTVSARFWLMDCQNVKDAAKMATELYKDAIAVPFMSKFVVFSKRHDPLESRLRVFCMTDDKMDKTLESQEHFTEVARSRDVEVLEGKPQYIEMGGNIVPVTKSGDQLYINFHAFRENRLPFTVRVRDNNADPLGRIAFMRDPKSARGEAQQQPICNLNITLPEFVRGEPQLELTSEERKRKYELMKSGIPPDDQISKAELRLTDIADALQEDWVSLGEQLSIPNEDIDKIQTEYNYVGEQALVMLHFWIQQNQERANGNELERALRKIGREDVIHKCMYNVSEVTDDIEKAVAKVHLDQKGFDELKDEIGPSAEASRDVSRDSSIHRGGSVDVNYDEQDLVKESESAAEESGSETSSVVEREKTPVESPVDEITVEAENKPDIPMTDVEELIKAMETAEVQGRDDRMSSSSDEQQFVITDDLKADIIQAQTEKSLQGMDDRFSESSEEPIVIEDSQQEVISEDLQEEKPRTPPPSPTEQLSKDHTGQDISEQELAAQLAGTETFVQETTTTTVESTPEVLLQESKADESTPEVPEGQTPQEEGTPAETETERSSVRVYTDTIEGEPEIETDVQEFEETLPDGTVVKRKVIKTRQKQTIVKRVVMEGPETDLPTTEEQAQAMLSHDGGFQPDLKYSDYTEEEPQTATQVQEYEETMPDGSVVKKKIVTTTEEQMKTSRTVMEASSPPPEILEGQDDTDDFEMVPHPVEESMVEPDLHTDKPMTRPSILEDEQEMSAEVDDYYEVSAQDVDMPAVDEPEVVPDLQGQEEQKPVSFGEASPQEEQLHQEFAEKEEVAVERSELKQFAPDDVSPSDFQIDALHVSPTATAPVGDQSCTSVDEVIEVGLQKEISHVSERQEAPNLLLSKAPKETLEESAEVVTDHAALEERDRLKSSSYEDIYCGIKAPLEGDEEIIIPAEPLDIGDRHEHKHLDSSFVSSNSGRASSFENLYEASSKEADYVDDKDVDEGDEVESDIDRPEKGVGEDEKYYVQSPPQMYMSAQTESHLDLDLTCPAAPSQQSPPQFGSPIDVTLESGLDQVGHEEEDPGEERDTLERSYSYEVGHEHDDTSDRHRHYSSPEAVLNKDDQHAGKDGFDEIEGADDQLSSSSSEVAQLEDVYAPAYLPKDRTFDQIEHEAEGEMQLVHTEDGDLDTAQGGELQTAKLVMKKQIHKKTIIRDGKEETIVTEDTHVEQDNEGPEELRDSMQQIIDQFMEGTAQMGGEEDGGSNPALHQ